MQRRPKDILAESTPVRNTEASDNTQSLLRPARTLQGVHAMAVTAHETKTTASAVPVQLASCVL